MATRRKKGGRKAKPTQRRGELPSDQVDKIAGGIDLGTPQLTQPLDLTINQPASSSYSSLENASKPRSDLTFNTVTNLKS